MIEPCGVFNVSPGASCTTRTTRTRQADGTPVPLDGASVDVGPWRITTKEGQAMSTEVRGLKLARSRLDCFAFHVNAGGKRFRVQQRALGLPR